MVDTRVTYEGGMRCRSEHDASGTNVLTDASKDLGGRGEHASPSDLLAMSLGGCILSITAIAAQAIDRDLAGATAVVTKEMADAPRRIARMAVTVRVPGAFDSRQRTRLEAAAHACPVHNALAIPVPIAFEWLG